MNKGFLAIVLVVLSTCGIVIGMDELTYAGKMYGGCLRNASTSTAVSSDGKRMVCLAKDGKSFSLFLAQEAKEIDFAEAIFNANSFIYTCVTISPDGNTIAVTGKEEIVFFDIKNLKDVRHFVFKFANTTKSLLFSGDSKRLITFGENMDICLWDIHNFQDVRKRSFPAGKENISDLVVNFDGSKVFGIADKTMVIFHITKLSSGVMRAERVSLELPYSIKGIAIDPCLHECFVVWDSANKMETCYCLPGSNKIVRLGMNDFYRENIFSAVFSPNGKMIVIVDEQGPILWWGTKVYRPSEGVGLLKNCSAVGFSKDNKKIFLCCNSSADKSHQLICYDIQDIINGKSDQLKLESIGDTAISVDVKVSNLTFNDDHKNIVLSGLKTVVFPYAFIPGKETVKEIEQNNEEKLVVADKKTAQKSKKKKRDKSGRKEKRAAAALLKSAQEDPDKENAPAQSIQSKNDQKPTIDAVVDGVVNAPEQRGQSGAMPIAGQDTPKKAVSTSSPLLRGVENFAHAVATVLNPKKREESFVRQGITFAAAVHPSAQRIEDTLKKKTIHFQDGCLEIFIPCAWKKRDKNPLLVRHSRHVVEKKENDTFHKLSIITHKKIGKYVDAQVFVDPKYKSYTGTKYTILGDVTLPSKKINHPGKKFSGEFQMTVVKNDESGQSKMIHNTFIPYKRTQQVL